MTIEPSNPHRVTIWRSVESFAAAHSPDILILSVLVPPDTIAVDVLEPLYVVWVVVMPK